MDDFNSRNESLKLRYSQFVSPGIGNKVEIEVQLNVPSFQ